MRFGLEIDNDWLPTRPRRYRALFLSDMHLGSRGCQSDRLADFLRNHEAETIYLVGDIVDGWRLGSKWYWPSTHNEIVQILLRAARRGDLGDLDIAQEVEQRVGRHGDNAAAEHDADKMPGYVRAYELYGFRQRSSHPILPRPPIPVSDSPK